jgi:glutamyl-tRNA synthetase
MNFVSTTRNQRYRGRLAPSPTGLLHVGHASTFWTAYLRAMQHAGVLVLRNEDLDPQRSRAEYAQAMLEDLTWLGVEWQEGPDRGGRFTPYEQSRRRNLYLATWRKLRDDGFIYPCTCSRRELAGAANAPNEVDDEPIYPGRCREKMGQGLQYDAPAGVNWRFRVPDGESVEFEDLRQGQQRFTAGRDFGDFVVWRRDAVPAYQLAVVADDAAMEITEIVRGADLLKSTARQLLLIRALGAPIPAYYHCELVCDASGVRLAKRNDALSLHQLRRSGCSPREVLEMCGH